LNVQSFGTEDRESLHLVEPSTNVYNIMTFKTDNVEKYKIDNKWKSLKKKYGLGLDAKIPDHDYEFEEHNRQEMSEDELKNDSKKFYDSKKSFYDNFSR